MFILRKLLKLLLMPVVLILFFTKWALETSIHLTGGIVGLLTLFIGGNIIYSIIVHSWTDTFLCSLIFAGIMAILMGSSCGAGFLQFDNPKDWDVVSC